MIYLGLAVFAAFVFHEGGHFGASLCLGYKIKFRREGFRGIWDMPTADPWEQKIIGLAGFGTELLAVPIFIAALPEFGLWYSLVAAAHFVAYPFYAGEANDFRWVVT